MNGICRTLFVALILVLAVPALAAGDRVALLRGVEGSVMVADKPARGLQALRVGETLTLAAGAKIQVDFLKSGLRQVAAGPATLVVKADGLHGKGSVTSQKGSRMSALPNIGAQKKMGGFTARSASPIEVVEPEAGLQVMADLTRQPPTFEILRQGTPFQGEYYAMLTSDEDYDLNWMENHLTGPVINVPAEKLEALKFDTTYEILVGTPDQASGYEGHSLRFRVLRPAEWKALEEAQESLQELAEKHGDPMPLVLLMEMYDERDQVAQAADAGQKALELSTGLPAEERRLLAEAVERLLLELHHTERARSVRASYLK